MWLQLQLANICAAQVPVEASSLTPHLCPRNDSLSSPSGGGSLAPLCRHVLQAVCVETIEVQPGRERRGTGTHTPANWSECPTVTRSQSKRHSPVDDVDHAVLTVIGAVEAQLVQEVQEVCREVVVKLVDGGFKARGDLQGVCVLC